SPECDCDLREFFPPSALPYPTAAPASPRTLSPLAQANPPAHSLDQMPRARTPPEISLAETSSNFVCPTCMGRQRARWRVTVGSDNQTARGARAAHILSGR